MSAQDSSERMRCNTLSADWARGEFAKLQPATQAELRKILAVLTTKGGPAATKRLRVYAAKRGLPHWVLLALRDILGAAAHHKIEL